MAFNIIFAGFGGQGILFSGKVMAYSGLVSDKEVSWLPSYGPEMRGGTANCSVCIDDTPIACPIVTKADVLVALNQPSYTKFISSVVPGGICIIDSTLVKPTERPEGVTIVEIPATKLALDNGLKGLANLIALGLMANKTNIFPPEVFEKGIEKCVPASKSAMLEKNKQALKLGYEFAC